MQLFITSNLHIQGDKLKISSNPELVRQLRKVLRAQPGYHFWVQEPHGNCRYHLQLQQRTDQDVHATILEKLTPPAQTSSPAMAIALPNKQEKLELIIQKLTEIWIQHIFLWSAERSVLKSLSPQKFDRLHKIMQEALEQSRGWSLPQIHILEDWESIQEQYQLLAFDLGEHETNIADLKQDPRPILGIIGPEGGLTAKDYQMIGPCGQKSLGSSVLRMETAAIIGARLLRNG